MSDYGVSVGLNMVGGVILIQLLAATLSAQPSCIADESGARLIANFQTASLICPKWQIVNRADYAFLLMQMKIIGVNDLLSSDSSGIIKLREPCQAELEGIEKESFKSAEELGVEKFCLQTSYWLTVPNIRYSLERNGFFPTSQK